MTSSFFRHFCLSGVAGTNRCKSAGLNGQAGFSYLDGGGTTCRRTSRVENRTATDQAATQEIENHANGHPAGHGMGSEFVVRLPVVQALAGQQRDDDADQTPSVPKVRRRILVADDNRDSADSLALLLNMMGNDTQTAHNGLEVLEVAASFRPAVILLDIGMPKLNGYDTARRIRQLKCHPSTMTPTSLSVSPPTESSLASTWRVSRPDSVSRSSRSTPEPPSGWAKRSSSYRESNSDRS